ncbi:unnamed protein product [Orchesella dallaii]|uniref:Uncharacterized protein n=1 Tax=Orchesella dallaii TaxID=48710 RepID=A0ABP1S0I9_9HEXA
MNFNYYPSSVDDWKKMDKAYAYLGFSTAWSCMHQGKICRHIEHNSPSDPEATPLFTYVKPLATYRLLIFYIIPNTPEIIRFKQLPTTVIHSNPFLQIPYILKYPFKIANYFKQKVPFRVIDTTCFELIFMCKFCDNPKSPPLGYRFKHYSVPCPRKLSLEIFRWLYTKETMDGKNLTFYKLRAADDTDETLGKTSIQFLRALSNSKSTANVLAKSIQLDEIILSILIEEMKMPIISDEQEWTNPKYIDAPIVGIGSSLALNYYFALKFG